MAVVVQPSLVALRTVYRRGIFPGSGYENAAAVKAFRVDDAGATPTLDLTPMLGFCLPLLTTSLQSSRVDGVIVRPEEAETLAGKLSARLA